jgi:hypothetical protein
MIRSAFCAPLPHAILMPGRHHSAKLWISTGFLRDPEYSRTVKVRIFVTIMNEFASPSIRRSRSRSVRLDRSITESCPTQGRDPQIQTLFPWVLHSFIHSLPVFPRSTANPEPFPVGSPVECPDPPEQAEKTAPEARSCGQGSSCRRKKRNDL